MNEKRWRQKSVGDMAFDIVLRILLAIFVIIVVYPLYFVVLASVSDPLLVSKGQVLLWPKEMSLFGFQKVFEDTRIWIGLRNTVIYTVLGTIINMAATLLYSETKDEIIRARADEIVREIGRCQEENGGEWCFSVPEKYLLWLKKGKRTWAPQYVCHKTMAGLLDMYQLIGNRQTLMIVKKAAEWFLSYTEDITDEQMRRMMWEESGGMMEFWADLYAVTGDAKHLELMRRYERKDLFELLETEQKSSAACGSKESMGIQDERFLVLPQYADAGKCVFS